MAHTTADLLEDKTYRSALTVVATDLKAPVSKLHPPLTKVNESIAFIKETAQTRDQTQQGGVFNPSTQGADIDTIRAAARKIPLEFPQGQIELPITFIGKPQSDQPVTTELDKITLYGYPQIFPEKASADLSKLSQLGDTITVGDLIFDLSRSEMKDDQTQILTPPDTIVASLGKPEEEPEEEKKEEPTTTESDLTKTAQELEDLGIGIYDEQYLSDHPEITSTTTEVLSEIDNNSLFINSVVPKEVFDLQEQLRHQLGETSGAASTQLTKDQIIQKHREMVKYYKFFINKRREYLARQTTHLALKKGLTPQEAVAETISKEVFEPAVDKASTSKNPVTTQTLTENSINNDALVFTATLNNLELTDDQAAALTALVKIGAIDLTSPKDLEIAYQAVAIEQAAQKLILSPQQEALLTGNPSRTAEIAAQEIAKNVSQVKDQPFFVTPTAPTTEKVTKATESLIQQSYRSLDTQSFAVALKPEAFSPTPLAPQEVLIRFIQTTTGLPKDQAEAELKRILSMSLTPNSSYEAKLSPNGQRAFHLQRGISQTSHGRANLSASKTPNYQSTDFCVRLAMRHKKRLDATLNDPKQKGHIINHFRVVREHTSNWITPLSNFEKSRFGNLTRPLRSLKDSSIARNWYNKGVHIGDLKGHLKDQATKAGLSIAKKVGSKALEAGINKLAAASIKQVIVKGITAAIIALSGGILAPFEPIIEFVVKAAVWLVEKTIGLAWKTFKGLLKDITGGMIDVDQFDWKAAAGGAAGTFLFISSLPVMAASVITFTFLAPAIFAAIIGGFLFFYIPTINIAPLLSTLVQLESGVSATGSSGGIIAPPTVSCLKFDDTWGANPALAKALADGAQVIANKYPILMNNACKGGQITLKYDPPNVDFCGYATYATISFNDFNACFGGLSPWKAGYVLAHELGHFADRFAVMRPDFLAIIGSEGLLSTYPWNENPSANKIAEDLAESFAVFVACNNYGTYCNVSTDFPNHMVFARKYTIGN